MQVAVDQMLPVEIPSMANSQDSTLSHSDSSSSPPLPSHVSMETGVKPRPVRHDFSGSRKGECGADLPANGQNSGLGLGLRGKQSGDFFFLSKRTWQRTEGGRRFLLSLLIWIRRSQSKKIWSLAAILFLLFMLYGTVTNSNRKLSSLPSSSSSPLPSSKEVLDSTSNPLHLNRKDNAKKPVITHSKSKTTDRDGKLGKTDSNNEAVGIVEDGEIEITSEREVDTMESGKMVNKPRTSGAELSGEAMAAAIEAFAEAARESKIPLLNSERKPDSFKGSSEVRPVEDSEVIGGGNDQNNGKVEEGKKENGEGKKENGEGEEGNTSDSGNEVFTCDRSHWRTDVCIMKGDIRVDARSDLILMYAKEKRTPRKEEKIKPYTRKWETSCMEGIQELTLKSVDVPEGLPENKNQFSEGNFEDNRKRRVTRRQLLETKGNGESNSGAETYWRLVRKVRSQKKSEQTDLRSKRLSLGISQLTFLEVVREKEEAEAKEKGIQLEPVDRGWREPQWESGSPPLNKTKDGIPLLSCDVYHNVPGVVFSTAGYTGNLYHEFNDGLIPLYITSQHLNGEVVLIIEQAHVWWFLKYEQVLRQMSKYPVVLLGQDEYVHCFRDLTVGLRIHDELTVDQQWMTQGGGIQEFQLILKQAWKGWPFKQAYPEGDRYGCRPLLSIISREGTRVLTNEEAAKRVAEEEGFFVRLLQPVSRTALQDMWHTLQESNVMMGVHGAGMTHFLFMRPKSAYIQIVPLGTDWAAKTYYGDPAVRLGLQYEEYKVEIGESSLSESYPPGDPILVNPQSVLDQGWWAGKEIYLEKQNVTLNLERFRLLLRKIKNEKLQNDPLYARQKLKATTRKQCRNKR